MHVLYHAKAVKHPSISVKMKNPAARERVPSLDGLRGLSILIVIVGHAAGTNGVPIFFERLHHLGNWGVKFFFVISGFIITKLLLDEQARAGSINLASFFVRRTAKIFPAYFVYVLVIGVAATAGLVKLMPGDFWHAMTFTMNYHYERGWYLNHTWSLAVEEQFYLVWPLAIILIGRARLPAACILIIALAPVYRATSWIFFDATASEMTRALPAAADALAAGALLALLHRDKRDGFASSEFLSRDHSVPCLILAFVIPVATYMISPGTFYIIGQTILIFFIAACIHYCILFPDGGIGKLVNHRFFVANGLISYSLYLWQEPFLNSYDPSWATTMPINIGLAYVFGALSFYFVERPARAMIVARFSPARQLART
jgi:peptidoglycan/LPS O-acetylase OafA/YrhL